MRRAIFLTGFNNWGKSSLLFRLFDRERFFRNRNYSIEGVDGLFTVESHSNDDFGIEQFSAEILKRLEMSQEPDPDLFATLCPTDHEYNNSMRFLEELNAMGFDEIHLLLIKFKWDLCAELRIDAIRNLFRDVPGVRFFVVEEDPAADEAERELQRADSALGYLQMIYNQ